MLAAICRALRLPLVDLVGALHTELGAVEQTRAAPPSSGPQLRAA